jgi:pyruvate/2-oxoglutarate dehydrogenase complex dihydrolipoamide acyltransferase (E2) component
MEDSLMQKVIAPNLGQSSMDITIETWHKKIGDKVEKGEPLFELSNEKLTQEVAALASGTLTKIYVEEGGETAPGSVIAEIE